MDENSSYHVIVAKYRENVEWTKNIPKENLFIYDKSGEIESKYIKLENIGRESHTYFTHVIEHYDKLPDYLIFLQGNPFQHLYYDHHGVDPSTIHLKIKEYVDRKITNILEFCGAEHPEPLHLMSDCKMGDYIDLFFSIPLPEYVKFSPGCQYIVPKNLILKNSLDFYKNVLNMLINGKCSTATGMECNSVDCEMHPWTFERLFPYFFKEKVKEQFQKPYIELKDSLNTIS
jgi:hypothetical protein